MIAATVTPAGVRDGDPEALAGLAARRGPSVLAYCRFVAAEGTAAAAAADAFARFRSAVAEAPDPSSVNPEALLLSATRHAAAQRAPHPVTSTVSRLMTRRSGTNSCEIVPTVLVARAEGLLSSEDERRLERHLEGCAACRRMRERFESAERAYRDPPRAPVGPGVASTLVAAMIAAAPITGVEGGAPAVREKAERLLGELLLEAPGLEDDLKEADDPFDPDTMALIEPADGEAQESEAEVDAPGTETDVPAAEAEIDAPEPEPIAAMAAEPAPLAPAIALPSSREAQPADADPAPPAPTDEPAPARQAAMQHVTAARGRAAGALTAAGGAVRALGRRRPKGDRRPGLIAGSPLPRPERRSAPAAPAELRPDQPRDLRKALVALPVVLTAIAAVVVLAVAGVFGGGDSSPTTDRAARAASPTPARSVPETISAPPAIGSARAVERAKARARAHLAGKPAATTGGTAHKAKPRTTEKKTTSTPTNAGTTATQAPVQHQTAASPTPQPAATIPVKTTPVKKPKPSSSSSGSSSGTVVSGGGASGSESVPSKDDASSIPDLAPPPKPLKPRS